jgi:ribonucleotide monophosphatase NagD (HAD superfamily)
MAPSQLAGLKAVLLDLSGTLHVGQTPTPGAVAALGRLRQAQLPLRFWCEGRRSACVLIDDLI